MVGVSAMTVRTDVHVVEKHLAVLDARKAVAQIDAALADRFDLRPKQHETRLKGFEQMEVVKRLPIFGDVVLRELALGFLRHVYAALASRAARSTAAIILSAS